MKTGPKPKGRGPALARGSAIDDLKARIERVLDKAEALIDNEGLNIETKQGVIQNPAVKTFKEMAMLLAKVRVADAGDDDEGEADAEPESVAGKFHARKAARSE